MSNLNLLLKMHQIKTAEYIEPYEINDLQSKRLNKLLKHVLNNSPFYQDYYQQHGITINNIDSISLKDLPFTNKKMIMDNFDDVVCNSRIKKADLEEFIADSTNRGKKYLGEYQVVHTSGTTGTRGIFVYGPKDWEVLKALVMVRVTKTKVNPFRKLKLASILETRGQYAGVTLVRDSPKLLFDLKLLNINDPLRENLLTVDDFKPDILSGYSSGIYLLALEQLKGTIDISPEKVVCSAELLTPKIKETIKQAFNLDPINFYAASESIGIGASCKKCGNLHLFNDWHCIELVDQNYNYVPKGTVGNLILTNLYNYTLPLIRYQMNDRLILNDNKCECGSPLLSIEEIQERTEDVLTFVSETGQYEYLHVSSIILMFDIPELEKIQAVQTDNNNLLLKVVIREEKGKVLKSISKKMKKILTQKGLNDLVSYQIKVVNDIENDPQTGKFNHFIPYKKTITE